MGKQSKKGSGRIKLNQPSGAISAPIGHYLESNIRFSLEYCECGNDYCIQKIEKNLLPVLYKKMGHLEKMTWRQIKQIPHGNGISIERSESSNLLMFQHLRGRFSTYGHFRFAPLARVFGAIDNDLFYIIRFDPDGKINHK